MYYSVVQKRSLHTYRTSHESLLFNGFSLFLLFSKFYINTEDIEIMTEQLCNYVVNKNLLNYPEYVLYF